ncbi:hypothetical protein D3C81_1347370 [compost metagenome]
MNEWQVHVHRVKRLTVQRKVVLHQEHRTTCNVVDPVIASSCTSNYVVLLQWITALTALIYEPLGILLFPAPDDAIDVPLSTGHILAGNPFHHVLIEYRCTLAV